MSLCIRIREKHAKMKIILFFHLETDNSIQYIPTIPTDHICFKNINFLNLFL